MIWLNGEYGNDDECDECPHKDDGTCPPGVVKCYNVKLPYPLVEGLKGISQGKYPKEWADKTIKEMKAANQAARDAAKGRTIMCDPYETEPIHSVCDSCLDSGEENCTPECPKCEKIPYPEVEGIIGDEQPIKDKQSANQAARDAAKGET